MKSLLLFAALTLTSSSLVMATEKAPRVYIIEPANNAVVESPVTIKFGLDNMEVTPAGVDNPHGGHHHLLIDTPLPADLTLPIPADEKHVHFGKGQTETTLELAPGEHSLQLLLGDYIHLPLA
jgi:hypothetical protein